jgi:hypothetical protein
MGLENKICLAFMNLKGEVSSGEIFRYFTKDNALEILKRMTNQDFGHDIELWEKWINENKPGILPDKNSTSDSLKISEERDSKLFLKSSYLLYLRSGLESVAAERLVIALENNKLELEAYALKTYLSKGSSSQCNIKSWGNRPCTISLDLPENPEPGDLWFDPIELNLAILIPNSQRVSPHAKSWVSTHPVYVWQYQTFLSLVKIGKKIDLLPAPDDYLKNIRVQNQENQKYITDIYHNEAIAYSNWMRKSLCKQSDLEAAKKYFNLHELNEILPKNLKVWTSGDVQKDYRIAVGQGSLDKDPSLDYGDIIEENHEGLEAKPDRMLYEEWDSRDNIGMLTKVAVCTELSQDKKAATLHYQLLNRAPRPVLAPTL